jgi:hypothetical protein
MTIMVFAQMTEKNYVNNFLYLFCKGSYKDSETAFVKSNFLVFYEIT